MLYKKTECPWCGNEITVEVSHGHDEQIKCEWCRRYILVGAARIKNRVVFDIKEKTFDECERDSLNKIKKKCKKKTI